MRRSVWRPEAGFSLHAVSSAVAHHAGEWQGARALPAASRRAPVPPHPSLYNCAKEGQIRSQAADTRAARQLAPRDPQHPRAPRARRCGGCGAAPCVSSARSGHVREETTLNSFLKERMRKKNYQGKFILGQL